MTSSLELENQGPDASDFEVDCPCKSLQSKKRRSPFNSTQVPTLPNKPNSHRGSVVQAHLLESQAGDERDASESISLTVSKEDEGPERESEHDRVELEVTVVDEDESGLKQEEEEVDLLQEEPMFSSKEPEKQG